MNTQQNINKLGANTPAQTLNQSQSPITPGADSDYLLFDFGNAVQLSESPDSVYHYFVASPVFAGFGDLNSSERIVFLDNLSRSSQSLKNYLTSPDTTELIFSLGKEMNFNDGQISEMGVLVRELLTGKIFIKDFPITLSSKLGIDDIKAGEIANKIISQSFGPIIEDVKRIQRSKFPDKISQLQKEGGQQDQPPTLTRPTAPPPPIRQALTPAQQLQQSTGLAPEVEPRKQIEVRPQSPQVPPRPPVIDQQPTPSTPSTSSGQASSRQTTNDQRQIPIPNRSQEPEVRSQEVPSDLRQIPKPAEVKPPQPQQPVRPAGQIEVRPQFDPGARPSNQPQQPIPKPPQNDAQKSLEEELEKVASVIDLRAQSKN